MSASAAAVLAAAAAAASVATAQSPEARDNPTSADVMSISLFMAIFFPVIVVLLAFACIPLFRPLDDDPAGAGSSASAPELSRRGPGGLDAEAITALPLVFYHDVRRHRIVDGRDVGAGDDVLECSVCLLEFDDDDALRLLPTCPHAFHPECIGLWLEGHTTCPLCRASLLDEPPVPPPTLPGIQPLPPLATAPMPPNSPPDHPAVVLIGDASDREEEEEADWTRIQSIARNRRAAGRQVLPRSNSTGHDGAGGGGAGRMERFALRLPEHARLEILMSHRLRHVTSAVESVRVREGSAHGSTVGGSVRSAVAMLLSRFAPGAGRNGDGDDKSFKAADAEAGASSLHRRENSSRGAVGEEKRSV